ncbi:hypothetical protein I6A60_25235 [Frankia sp. AgB1.9]|uniref:hypothetical protein n=1 Tax=unclassified Frankia TaxID=2632575 RepID=UPI001933BCB1|nr:MULTISPECIES: hypothetical protein [unclassified Frankia]MBL7491629.1 hypothetical protein [Frankia sp. AgW1.1]MBL7551143.1 hypothetical protein [Frankia sp. AgB1.9]MBL7621870.1 hypothetical protein [Frankia sp. AgB1.8]
MGGRPAHTTGATEPTGRAAANRPPTASANAVCSTATPYGQTATGPTSGQVATISNAHRTSSGRGMYATPADPDP